MFGRPESQGIMEVILENDAPVAGLQFRIQPVDSPMDGGEPPPPPSPHVWLNGIINDLENQGFTLSHATDDGMVATVLLFHSGGGWIEPGEHVIMELVWDLHDPPILPWWINIATWDVVISDPGSQSLPFELWPGSIHIAEPGDVAGGPIGEGDGGVAALQATLRFDPARVRLGAPRLDARLGGFSVQHHVADGELRMVVYSLSGGCAALRARDHGADPGGGVRRVFGF